MDPELTQTNNPLKDEPIKPKANSQEGEEPDPSPVESESDDIPF